LSESLQGVQYIMAQSRCTMALTPHAETAKI